jgi:hypothetical protein
VRRALAVERRACLGRVLREELDVVRTAVDAHAAQPLEQHPVVFALDAGELLAARPQFGSKAH